MEGVVSYLQNRYQRIQIINSYLNSNTVSKWTKIKYGVPQGSILGPFLFLVYINDLPMTIENRANPTLFANDTRVLIASPNNIQFQNNLNIVSGQLSMWLKANLLSLNFDKTYFIQFITKSKRASDTNYI
jgi:hypothetical protein